MLTPKKKPKRRQKPTNLALPPDLKEWATAYARARGMNGLSEMVRAMLRAEFDRELARRQSKP